MQNINPLLEGFDSESFRTLESYEGDVKPINDMAREVKGLWSRNIVRNVCSDVDTPDIDTQDSIGSPYDFHMDTHSRVSDLLGWMIVHTANKSASTLVFDSLPEWSSAVKGYDNPHWPIFGVIDNGRLLTIYDARNGIEIVINQTKANPEADISNNVTFWTINDMYRGLKQVVTVTELEEGKYKASASIVAFDFDKNEAKGRGYTVTSD